MKKISQGKYELFTTKADAIDKFMQLQGVCREEISDENPIEFYCTKEGKITITNPPRRNIESCISTNLFAEIIDIDGKTYVNYYTEFSKSNNVLKIIYIIIYLLLGILSIAAVIITKLETYHLLFLAVGLVLFGINLFAATKEEKNSPKDSEILVNELKKRVEAVNLWDK